jgi:lipopolysaccharide export system ATP-binding protein
MNLCLSAVSKSYKRRRVVDNISLCFEHKGITALLGPNGAGKTTLFYIAAGLITADTGKVFLDGRDITQKPIYERAKMGVVYLPQESSVFQKLNVKDNILAVLEHRRELTAAERQSLCRRLITEMKLEAISSQQAGTLSGGERRRTEIARAMAMEPQFLLLDEPFAGIDPIAVQGLQQTIRALAESRRTGIIITDHNARAALRISSFAYIINQGVIAAADTADAIKKNEAALEHYLGYGENYD